MTDLAQSPVRREAARRLTTNRSSILPSRRETDLPAMAVRADMRAAARGDGGADELRRVLNDFTNSTQKGLDARIRAEEPQMEREAAQAVLDAQAGDADPAYAKSLAYQEAYYRSRTQRRLIEFRAQASDAVAQAVAGGADLDEIDGLLTENVKGFLDTEVQDLPQEASLARLDVAAGIRGMTQELAAKAISDITERTRSEVADNTGFNFVAQFEATGQIDLEGNLGLLTDAGWAPAAGIDKLIDSAVPAATDPRNPRPELLEQLLDSRKADGKTPSLNATQQQRVQERLAQARNAVERKEEREQKERREALTFDLVTKAFDGEYVDDDIETAIRSQTLDPQEGAALLGLVHGLKNSLGDGFVNEDFVLQLQERALKGNPPSTAEINRFREQGRFGTGRAAITAALGFVEDNVQRAKADRAASERASRADGAGSQGLSQKSAMTNNVSNYRSWLNSQYSFEGASPTQRLQGVDAVRTYNARVANGEDPREVATALAAARTGGGSPPAQGSARRMTYDAQGRLK